MIATINTQYLVEIKDFLLKELGETKSRDMKLICLGKIAMVDGILEDILGGKYQTSWEIYNNLLRIK